MITVVTVGGAAFLFWYGLSAFRRAMHPDGLRAGNGGAVSLKAAVGTCLALTFLNPHVYLDTVVLVGSLSARFEGQARLAYGLGAIIASLSGFLARLWCALAAAVFAKPSAWRILDCIIGIIMWAIAFSLLSRLLWP